MGEETKSLRFWHRTNLAKHSLAINARGHAVERARQILGGDAADLGGEWERGGEGGFELFFVN